MISIHADSFGFIRPGLTYVLLKFLLSTQYNGVVIKNFVVLRALKNIERLNSKTNFGFADLQWFNFPPCYSDIEVSSRVCQYTMTLLLAVVTEETEQTSDHTQPYQSVMLVVVRGAAFLIYYAEVMMN